MKKTLIALMALVGVATAAEETVSDLSALLTKTITESGYTAAGNFNYEISFTLTSGIPYRGDNGGAGGNGGYIMELEEGYYFLSVTHNTWGLSNTSTTLSIDADTFTFSKDGTLYTYTSNSGENIYTSTVTASDSSESGYNGSGGRNISGATANVGITLAYNGADTILTFDVDTTNSNNIVDKFVLKDKEIDLSGLKLTTNDTTNVGAMSVSIQSVPEPTTATLSLLALCGLAARRRRK